MCLGPASQAMHGYTDRDEHVQLLLAEMAEKKETAHEVVCAAYPDHLSHVWERMAAAGRGSGRAPGREYRAIDQLGAEPWLS